MGGRGTFASGKNDTPFVSRTVGLFHGIKVLEGIGARHNLPEEAHTSLAYAKLFKDGNLQMLRFYDENKFLRVEIGYHPEPGLTGHHQPIYHIHTYTRLFERSHARFLTREEVSLYGRYFTQKGHLQ